MGRASNNNSLIVEDELQEKINRKLMKHKSAVEKGKTLTNKFFGV
jgi:hypothetical protein